MKAIVTGATGGLGRNLTQYLKDLGWEVIAMGRNSLIGKELGTSFIQVELSNSVATLEAFETADVLFHCAALSSPWGKYADFYSSNVLATRHVLEAMKHYHIPKIIHVSTPSIYFNFTDKFNVKETYLPKKFVNHYAQTKYEAEQEVLGSDIHSVIIRPRGIFGEFDQVLLPRLEKMAQKGFLPLLKNKETIVDVTYVGNVVHALHLAATKNIPTKSIFNITNHESKTIREIYTLLSNVLGLDITFKEISLFVLMSIARVSELIARCGLTHEPLITRYGVGLITVHQTLDISNAEKLLGYKPIYTIEEGLARYGTWKHQNI